MFNNQSIKNSDQKAEIHVQEKSSYRQIFKATSLFGGVQIFNILIGIIRTKFVAILLGTIGVGTIGLLNSPLQLIASITALGIAFSGVRDISEAYNRGNQFELANVITALRRWSWITGFLGMIVTIGLAPLLSQWSFGNREYTWAFIWLSIILLLQSISRSQSSLLQGTRRLSELAKASVIGSSLGLITSIPLFYRFGVKGIVPALILTALTSLFLSWFYSRRIILEKTALDTRTIFRSGFSMVRLGLALTAAAIISTLSIYILNAFISKKGGVEQVGLYNAGWNIIGQYTALVFSAMATDYFPRLSAINNNNEEVRKLASQQIRIAMLIVSPLLALLIFFMPLVIRILYSQEFLPVVMFASIASLCIPFKTISWAMGYIYIAKRNSKLFMLMEIISGSVILLMNILSYYYYGLNGLGASFIITYFLVMLSSYYLLKRKYDFKLPREIKIECIILYCLILLTFLTRFINLDIIKLISGVLVITLVLLFSINKLNSVLDLRFILTNLIKSSKS